MKPTVKYAAILSCLGFILMAIPGAISIAFGFPMLLASLGLALGIILCVKGKIASKIFGSGNYRTSATILGVGIILLTGIKAVSSVMSTLAYIRLFGYDIPTDRSYMLGQYTAILAASFFYACLIFMAIIIKSKFKKSHNLEN